MGREGAAGGVATVDPFSEVFTAMRVRSAMYCRMEARAPWGVEFPASPQAKFGLVTRGSCWLAVAGEPRPVPLRGGDCYIVAASTRFAMRDAPRTPLIDAERVLRRKVGDLLRVGKAGPETHIISGLFELDAWSSKPLLDLLPRVICVRADQANTGALGATLDLLAVEAAGQAIGSPIVTSRLAEILFIQCIRAHHAAAGAAEMGWLSALGDPRLGAALRAIHQAPARPWSVGALAAVAGMSRSAFAPRFKARVGETPLGYLTRWRMYKAGCALREGDQGIAAIARSVGYESTGAFNRVFQRAHGQTPGAFRRQRRP